MKSLSGLKKKVLNKSTESGGPKKKRKSNPNPRSLIRKKPQPQPSAKPNSRKGRKKYKEENIQDAIKKVFNVHN